jgi:hypothetical protein
MRIVGLALALLTIALAAGCGAKKASPRLVFTPFTPASVEAAALKSGTCLAARTDGDPKRMRSSRTRCARHMPALSYVMVDFHRCPVQYVARGAAFGVVVCQDESVATTEWRGLRAGLAEQFGEKVTNCIRVRNVILYGGEERMRALARALRS